MGHPLGGNPQDKTSRPEWEGLAARPAGWRTLLPFVDDSNLWVPHTAQSAAPTFGNCQWRPKAWC